MLSYNGEDEYLEYFFPQLVSWFANESGLIVTYSKFNKLRARSFQCHIFSTTDEQIKVCYQQMNCIYGRNFSAQLMAWMASDKFSSGQLKYSDEDTGKR
jgi:hypothetical protein